MPILEQSSAAVPRSVDLVAMVLRVLAASSEPLTVPRIRAQLPSADRQRSMEELTDCLHRQVAAGTVFAFPRYRSQYERFWDRSLPTHVSALVRSVLEGGACTVSQLHRQLPDYALPYLETVLAQQLAQGLVHQHPPLQKRAGVRFGLGAPDPREFLRAELKQLLMRISALGFPEPRVRAAALELLHEAEWAPAADGACAQTEQTTIP